MDQSDLLVSVAIATLGGIPRLLNPGGSKEIMDPMLELF
jgi:hypothetical protein